ncbi:MAG: hypothetical protein QMA97_00585, partial [Glaciecola sp.]
MFVNFTRKSLLAIFLSSMVLTAVAKDVKDEKKEDEKEKETLTEILAKKEVFEGFFTIYRDKKDGSGLVVLDGSQLNRPFLYFVSTLSLIHISQ